MPPRNDPLPAAPFALDPRPRLRHDESRPTARGLAALGLARAIEWSSVRRILVVRLDNLGDVILTGPALRALKDHLPHVHLTLLASPGGAPAAALLPWVDDLVPCRALWQDLGRLGFDPARERQLVAGLRRGAYDLALVLTSFSQTPHPAALACALAGIPARIGASRERGRALTVALPHLDDDLHQCERNLQLVERLGVPVADRRLEIRLPRAAWSAAGARLAAHGVSGDYLVWNPFASCDARTYDPLRHALAARALAEYADLRVVVCGSARDRDRARELAPLLGPRGLDLVGETDLLEFAALLAGARLVLTNNTAALHLADALAVPQLVTYAGTDRDSQWRPRASPHRLLRRATACAPCYRFACPTAHECLALAPAEVLAAGLSLLAETAPRA
ncbi:glycosyltransferase family 9 protein [Nannocystis bainbridge]|uniref:Glycosyltransferase family 9 protein n=1 Tax=Nannocystis bainbridge TaxID=2995303 RepID=A0ABT5DPS9_9BACT|nr:glycosyltransferase family 9 protein [Nannocystis bainbridge]MDC0715664.1 glycosyltransferase family 9 protein [Nannocystis bainbridge]